jgi:hypothetical protein
LTAPQVLKLKKRIFRGPAKKWWIKITSYLNRSRKRKYGINMIKNAMANFRKIALSC